MYSVIILKSTGKLIMSQSGIANPEVMAKNAVSSGFKIEDVEIKVVEDEVWEELYLLTTKAERDYATNINSAKLSDLNSALPDWATVETNIRAVASLADAKAILLKLARVVYWLAKNKAD